MLRLRAVFNPWRHWSYCGSKLRPMAARKYSASMDEDLLDEVERAAREAGVTVSAWLAQAARDRVAALVWRRAFQQFEAEHGPFTEAQRQDAREWFDMESDPRDLLAELHNETA